MTHDRDKILLRAKDITLLVLVFTLFGFLFGPMKKIFEVNEMIAKVAKIENEMNEQKVEIAVTNSQYSDIQRQLEQINWQLRKLNSR